MFQQNSLSDNHKNLFRLKLLNGRRHHLSYKTLCQRKRSLLSKRFCSCPSFLDEPREETLATQAKENVNSAIDISNFSEIIPTLTKKLQINLHYHMLKSMPLKFEISIVELTFSLTKSLVVKIMTSPFRSWSRNRFLWLSLKRFCWNIAWWRRC